MSRPYHCCSGLQSWLPARALVQKAIHGRFEVDSSGQIIKLPVAGCPWKEHLAQLEEEQKLGDAIKFCMYEVWAHLHDMYHVSSSLTQKGQLT